MRMRKHNRGFTLIEMIVSTAILSMVAVTIAALLSQGIRGWRTGTDKDAAVGGATLALQKLSADIRDGQSATVDTNNRLAVSFPATVTDGTSGEKIYDYSGTGSITRRYYLLNGKLIRQVGTATTVLATGLSGVEIGASPTSGSVSITIKAYETTATKVKTEVSVSGRVSLRNFRS